MGVVLEGTLRNRDLWRYTFRNRDLKITQDNSTHKKLQLALYIAPNEANK